MARKSSFLQGFEVGADLYNRGFSQAQSMAEMQQRAKDREYQRGRDKVLDSQRDRQYKLDEGRQKLAEEKLQLELNAAKREKELDAKVAQRTKDFKGMMEAFKLYAYGDVESQKHLFNTVEPAFTAEISSWGVKDLTDRWNLWTDSVMRDSSMNDLRNARIRDNIVQKAEGEAIVRQLAENEKLLNELKNYNIHYRPSEMESARDMNSRIIAAKRMADKGVLSLEDFPEFESNHPLFTDLQSRVDAYEITQAEKDEEARQSVKAQSEGEERRHEIWKRQQDYLAQAKKSDPNVYNLSPEHQAVLLAQYDKAESDKIYESALEGNVQFEKLRRTVASATTTGVKDVALIQQFFKTLDPRSAVLQGEQEQGANAGGVVNRALNLVNQLKSGQSLPQEVRDDILTVARWANNASLAEGHRAIESYAERMESVTGSRHEFQSLRDRLSMPQWQFNSEKEYRNAEGMGFLTPGSQGHYLKDGKEWVPFTVPAGRTPSTPRPEVPPVKPEEPAVSRHQPSPDMITGTQQEIQSKISEMVASGQYSGKVIRYQETGSDIIREYRVPEGPQSNEPADGASADGQPVKTAPPDVQSIRVKAQSDLDLEQSGDQPEEKLELAASEPTAAPPMDIEAPAMPLWSSEEERKAMVDDQLRTFNAMKEFQSLAENGGGGDPYTFLRHRVKIGNVTGEIVRTNSRGVFIKIPNGPTRFMSWGGLSKRIESGDFKPNKARLNQQLKGE